MGLITQLVEKVLDFWTYSFKIDIKRNMINYDGRPI